MIFRVPASRLLAPVFLCAMVAAAANASVQSELAFHRGVVAYGEDRLDEAKRQFERVLAEDAEDDVSHSEPDADGTWYLNWTSPSGDVGPIHIWLAGNSVDGGGGDP